MVSIFTQWCGTTYHMKRDTTVWLQKPKNFHPMNLHFSGRIILVMVLFSWSILPATYLLSFLFSVPLTGFTRIAVINIITGITPSHLPCDILCLLLCFKTNCQWLDCRQWCTQEFCSGGGSTNSVEDRGQRERGSGGSSPLVRGSGGSCNLVQEILFHIVKFS